MVGIYKITNTINGKYYIGSSRDIEDRFKRHLSGLKNGIHKNKHLQSAYNKYSKEAFLFEVLEECSIRDLITKEQHYIDQGNWNNMYNKTKQAYGGGSDAMSLTVVLLHVDGHVVDMFYSGKELARYLNYTNNLSYGDINTSTPFRRIFRIVTFDFFQQNQYLIYTWENYDELYEKSC